MPDKYVTNFEMNDGTIVKVKDDEAHNDITQIYNNLSSQSGFVTDLTTGGKRVLVIGDSVAYGIGWSGSEGIITVLRQRFPNNDYVNAGIGGATISMSANTTANLISEWYNVSNKNFDYVIVICGINDVTDCLARNINYIGRVRNFLFNYPLDNDKTLDALASFFALVRSVNPYVKMYYITPPGAGGNEPMYSAVYELYKYVCDQCGVPVIDMHTYIARETINSIYMNDHYHPNQKGYELMTDIILGTVNSNGNQNQHYGFKVIPVSIDLSGLRSLDFDTYFNAAYALCSELAVNYELAYTADSFIVTNFNTDDMVWVEFKRLWNRVFWFKICGYTFNFPALKFRVRMSGEEGARTFEYIYDGADADQMPYNLSSLGITSPYDIPFSGTWQNTGDEDLDDMPTGATGHVCTFVSNVRIYKDSRGEWVKNKIIQMVGYGFDQNMYVWHYITNVSGEFKHFYSIPMTRLDV